MNWLKLRKFSYLISIVLIITGLVAIVRGGLQPALEFTGGSQLTIESSVSPEELSEKVNEIVEEEEAITLEHSSQRNNQLVLQLNEISADDKTQFLSKLQDRVGQPVTEAQFQTVGPAISRDLIVKTMYAIGLGILSILLYLWWQFKNWRFGLAGVLAMIHDSLILLGAFAWLGLWFEVKVDLLFVTALLTTLSFSVHDTIVIFDRIRDLQKETRRGDQLAWLANTAVTQTLPRSLNNSLTIIFMLVVLLLLGGDTLRWFTAALLVGTITGTYSSTFTAVPLYFDLQKRA